MSVIGSRSAPSLHSTGSRPCILRRARLETERILLRAARLILDDIGDTVTRFPEGSAGRLLFGNQLAWFEQGPVTPAPAPASAAPCSLSDVQGGILTSYDATHGALLLIAFEDAARAHAFLSTLKVTSEEHAAATAGALDEILHEHRLHARRP